MLDWCRRLENPWDKPFIKVLAALVGLVVDVVLVALGVAMTGRADCVLGATKASALPTPSARTIQAKTMVGSLLLLAVMVVWTKL